MILNMKFLLKKCINYRTKILIINFFKSIIKFSILLLSLSFISFMFLQLGTQNSAEVTLRANEIVPTQENIKEVAKELNLNKPLSYQYLSWLKKAIRGDLGYSFTTKENVILLIKDALVNTLYLTSIVFLVLIILSIGLGVISAFYKNIKWERLLRLLLFVISSIPSFLLGIVFISCFSLKFHLFPTNGMENISSVVLPATTLVCANLATYVRIIRKELLETMEQPFIFYYKVRNFSQKKITYHLLKNSLRSSFTALSVNLPKLIAGSAVVENIFSWPGMGVLCVRAIKTRDIPLLQGYIVIMAIFFILSNTLINWINKRIDPRLERRVVQ
ncbi:TPA: ABC transporter permease [Enterococcus faecium]|uniref:ABC transporter permease n=2 Tax=Enterococcus faecium TaxID=1352 RepID=UPI0038D367B2|nr:ABC transporter permease [Enterococcus faecium]